MSVLGRPETILLSVPEVAERLGVSRRTVERLIAGRELKSVKVGSLTRVRESELLRYLESLERK